MHTNIQKELHNCILTNTTNICYVYQSHVAHKKMLGLMLLHMRPAILMTEVFSITNMHRFEHFIGVS